MTNSCSDTYNPFKSTHSFPIDLATALKSADMAIFLHHINYWLELNERMKKNFHDERYWTYDTIENLHAHFPFWTVKQLRLIIDKLVARGILIKGNYNDTTYDRTTWYSIDWNKVTSICPNGQMHIPKKANRIAQKGKPIPDTIPNASIESVRKPYGNFVELSDEEYENLCKKEPKEKVDEIIEEINDHCTNNRKEGYTDYVAAFRTFLRNKNKTQGKIYGNKHSGGIGKGKVENPTGIFVNGKRVE
jgi:hypothetical protein